MSLRASSTRLVPVTRSTPCTACGKRLVSKDAGLLGANRDARLYCSGCGRLGVLCICTAPKWHPWAAA